MNKTLEQRLAEGPGSLPNGFGLTEKEIGKFLALVRVRDGCWTWQGSKDRKGRGKFYPRADFRQLAHRVMWALLHGPIPEGRMICHHCDVPGCVNPAHIYCGTAQTNTDDMIRRKRAGWIRHPEVYRENARQIGLRNTWHRGAGNPKAKITAAQAKAIRASKIPTRFLVKKYGLSRGHIQKIRRGDHWS